MALIQLTEAEAVLYRAWLAYYGKSTYVERTHAFFNARKGLIPPRTK